MSISLSSQQLTRSSELRFVARLAELLQSNGRGAVTDNPELAGEILGQYTRAASYGLVSELDVARYVVTAWTLGADFDERFPAARELLAAPNLTPTQKSEALELLANAVLTELAQSPAKLQP